MKTKEQLEESAEQYQSALETDLSELIDRSKNILAGAAVLGIGFWIGYKIYKSFSDEEKKETDYSVSRQEPSVGREIRNLIMKELAIFLLDIIKERVAEFLQERTNQEAENEEDH